MDIRQAVETAMQKRCCITVPEFAGKCKIRPTNGQGNCIVLEEDGGRQSKHGWQPTADDLVRDDWMIVE